MNIYDPDRYGWANDVRNAAGAMGLSRIDDAHDSILYDFNPCLAQTPTFHSEPSPVNRTMCCQPVKRC
jgi:hypothetical protein